MDGGGTEPFYREDKGLQCYCFLLPCLVSISEQCGDDANADGEASPGLNKEGAESVRNEDADLVLRSVGAALEEMVHDNLTKETDIDLEMQEMEAYRNYEAMKETTRQREADAEAAKIQQNIARTKLENLRKQVLDLHNSPVNTPIAMDAHEEASFSAATKTSRRSTPAKSLENLTLSNRFEAGTEDIDKVVIEADEVIEDATNTSNIVEEDARNLGIIADKELADREKKELDDKKKKRKLLRRSQLLW